MRHWTAEDVGPYRRDIKECFGYRPNKDLYLTLHNKKETRGRYGPRVSTSHLCLITDRRCRFGLQQPKLSQELSARVTNAPYTNTHRKVFCFFFSKKKRKLLLQANSNTSLLTSARICDIIQASKIEYTVLGARQGAVLATVKDRLFAPSRLLRCEFARFFS